MPTLVSSHSFAWHRPLIDFLPLVRSVASHAFCRLDPAAREDAIQEVIANTTVGFESLVARRQSQFWLIKPLAKFSVRQWKAGRRVGSSANKNDVMSEVPRHQAFVESLEATRKDSTTSWREIIADSRNTDPAEAACFRIDFDHWLNELPDWHRQVALALSDGSSTGDVARKLQVSPGRVSQLRKELQLAWENFQEDVVGVGTAIAAA